MKNVEVSLTLDQATRQIKTSAAQLDEASLRFLDAVNRATKATWQFNEAPSYPQRYRWNHGHRVPVRTPDDVVGYLTRERDDYYSYVTTAEPIAQLLLRRTIEGAVAAVERAAGVATAESIVWDPVREHERAFREGRLKSDQMWLAAWCSEDGVCYRLQADRVLTESIGSQYFAYRSRAYRSPQATFTYLEFITRRSGYEDDAKTPVPPLYEPVGERRRQAQRMSPIMRELRAKECRRIEWVRYRDRLRVLRLSFEVFEQHLTAEQLTEWRTEQYVTVTALSGETYCITPHGSYNVFRLTSERLQCCIVPAGGYRDYPLGDVMLSQLLLLRHDEQRFLNIANKRSSSLTRAALANTDAHEERREMIAGLG